MVQLKTHNKTDRSQQIKFDDFIFDIDRLELSKKGKLIPLKIQPARLLHILLESAPKTVSRKTLQEKIWDNGTTVEFDHGLNACVNQLRSVLGEDAHGTKFITTLPKRGYRFAVPVSRVQEGVLAGEKKYFVIGALAAICAVFGFWGLILNKPVKQAVRIYIAPVVIEGVVSTQVENVAQYALRLGTVGRLTRNDLDIIETINGVSLWQSLDTEIEKYKIDYSLFMTLKPDGQGGYVVDANIVNVGIGTLFDTETFRTETLDAQSLMNVSDKIAMWSIAVFGNAMQSQKWASAAVDPAYFNAIIKAQRLFQTSKPQSLKASVAAFDEALAIKPDAAEAKGGKAVALVVLAGGAGFPARQTYQQALSLADDIRKTNGPTLHSELTRGFVFLYRDWDLLAARQAFDLAVALAPGEAIAHAWRAAVLGAQGDAIGAAKEVDIAVKLDPLSMAIVSDRCWYLGAAKQYEAAITACTWVLGVEPGNFSATTGMLRAYEKLERYAQARAVLAPILKSIGSAAQLGAATTQTDAQALQSDYCALADYLAPQAKRSGLPLTNLASFEAGCGRYARALDLLQRAKSGGESGILFYKIDPSFAAFRTSNIGKTFDAHIKKRTKPDN